MPHNQLNSFHLKYRPDIDGLRAFAVLAVVAFHAFPMWLIGGFIGVDVFFVISGYLISTIIFENLDKNSFNFFEFYAQRIKRIFPALILVLIACFIFGWFALLVHDYKQLGKHILAGASFLSNIVLWNEVDYFDNTADTKPLLHLWSLGIEEQFYILWPLFIWIAWKRGFNLLTITAVIAITSFMLNLHGIKHDPTATFYSPQTRFWELLSGSLLAWIYLYKNNIFVDLTSKIDTLLFRIVYNNRQEDDGKTLANVLSFIGLSLLLCGFWKINKESSFPGWLALIPVLGTVLIIAAGSSAWINRIILSNKVVVWFGLISFPLYLWHWPILSFARIIEGEVPSRNIRILAVVLSVVLAWLTYKLIERPVRLARHNKFTVAVLVMLMSIVGCIGYITETRNGLGFRFPKIVQKITNYNYDEYQLGYRYGTCFLTAVQTFNDFSNCQTKNLESRNKILIWGDSHAAHLYPGIKKYYELSSNIIQYTASSCPPMLNFDKTNQPHCRPINDFVIDEIRKEHPDTVILSASWIHYNLSNLDNTIQMLKKINIRNIVVIGPVTMWDEFLPKLLISYFNKSFPHIIPERLITGFDPKSIELDKDLKSRFENSSVKYISVISILCNSSGCLTQTGDATDPLLTWDNSHFTNAGSEFLVRKFQDF